MKFVNNSFNTKKISINNILMISTNSMLRNKRLLQIKPKREDRKDREEKKIEMKIMMKQLDSTNKWCSSIMMRKEMSDMLEIVMQSHALSISTSHKMTLSTPRN